MVPRTIDVTLSCSYYLCKLCICMGLFVKHNIYEAVETLLCKVTCYDTSDLFYATELAVFITKRLF